MQGYRLLALAVLDRAMTDAADGLRPERQADARAFLSGSTHLAFWCSIAGFDPVAVAGRLMAPPTPKYPPIVRCGSIRSACGGFRFSNIGCGQSFGIRGGSSCSSLVQRSLCS